MILTDKLPMKLTWLKGLSLIFISSILYVSGCGGDMESEASSQLAKDLIVSIHPARPLVVPAERPIRMISGDMIVEVTIMPPNVQFKLELDNKLGNQPITILAAHMEVTGPKGLKSMFFQPSDLYRVITTGPNEGSFVLTNRSALAEVGANQKTSCMDKTDYLEGAVTCPAGTTEPTSGSNLCCPTGLRSLNDQVALIASIQDGMTPQELADPSVIYQVYQFNLTLIGWVGTFMDPQANFRKNIQFQSSGF